MTFPLFGSVVGGLLARSRVGLGRRDTARFLATVSHELRTPLNAILGWVNLLKSGTRPSTDTARALDGIERSVQLETRLVDELLDASRLLGGRAALVLAPIDFRSAVEAAVARATPAATAKGVEIVVVRVPSRKTMVSGDHRRLEDAVGRLLANAVKFTPVGGSIQIGVERSSSRVFLRVADTGEGHHP